MLESVTVGDIILDRVTLRGLVRSKIDKAARAAALNPLGRWGGPLFRFTTPRGRNILTAAIYRAPDSHLLVMFVWLFGRMFPVVFRAHTPRIVIKSHTGGGKWSW